MIRALSAGIVGVGDKLGQLDQEVVRRLAFHDGNLAQPDHPLYPVASTLTSGSTAFYTETTVDGYRWTYLALFNLTEEPMDYSLDLEPILGAEDMVFDFHAGAVVTERQVTARAGPGEGCYLIGVPRVGGLFPLGFLDKYVPVSGRQVKGITGSDLGVAIDMELPAGREYTFAVLGAENLSATGKGIRVSGVEVRGGFTCVDFGVESTACRLVLFTDV